MLVTMWQSSVTKTKLGAVLVEFHLTRKAEPRDRDEAYVLFELHLTRKAELVTGTKLMSSSSSFVEL